MSMEISGGGNTTIGGSSGNALLLRFINSPHFTLFLCISYLERYADNVGIHFYLCQRLRSYPTEEIEFFLPQLVQLQVTVETESMALEDLLLDLCDDSTHCTLLIFWQLQAHLTELASEPESYSFQICKRLYNKLQYMLFNIGNAPAHKLRENTFPAIILSSALAASMGFTQLGEFIKPLAVSQGRKQRSHIFHLASKLLRSKSISNLPSPSTPDLTKTEASSKPKRMNSKVNKHLAAVFSEERGNSMDVNMYSSKNQNVVSLPDLNNAVKDDEVDSPEISPVSNPVVGNIVSPVEKTKALKTNYFRCETQFVYALQAISSRLLQVPKQARLSALRAELAMLNQDLPCEVDIPLLLPTNTNGPEAKQNRIVRISPAEATVLNSAERVPFLMLIEYIKNDVDFNPDSKDNVELLQKDELERRYIFDMTYLHNQKKTKRHNRQASFTSQSSQTSTINSPSIPVEEKDMSDISTMNLLNEKDIHTQESLSASVSALNRLQQSNSVKNHHDGEVRSSDLSFSVTYRSNEHYHSNEENSNLNGVDVTDLATHMRTAAIMLTQLDAGMSKLSREEIMSIKSKIIASMQSMEEHTAYAGVSGEAGERKLENDLKTSGMGSNSDDPSAANLGEDWASRKERIRKSSPYGSHPNWDLFSVIAKTGNDLRQEAFACQLIQAIQKIWIDSDVDVWVKRMRILITNDSSGLVETITNGLSVHSIKKSLTNASITSGNNPKATIASLSDHFEKTFGERDSEEYTLALEGFVKSLAAYSIICYILQIKDRHNGNILLDNQGHIIHIDFGFLLSNSPGRFGFEAAPFKLTQEYVDLLGGIESEFFQQYRSLLKQAFKALRKHAESIIILVEMMARDSNLPCFSSGPATALQLRQRFQLQLSEAEVDMFVDSFLIQKSIGSIYTRLYDQYQLLTQGIYS